MDTHLEGATLWGTNLEGAVLIGANLDGADFGGNMRPLFESANLERANLRRARLAGARNLTVEQLSTVKSLQNAHLDPPLREQIKQQYPHLLEQPF